MKLPLHQLSVKTQRLILRPYARQDFEAWRAERLERKPKQNEFDRGPLPRSLLTKTEFNKSLRFFDKAAERDLLYNFGVFHRATGESVGRITIGVISRLVYQFANLGYEISNQHWEHGYATEGVQGVFPLAFKTLKLHRLEAGIETHNRASRRVAEKSGMKLEGLREKYYFDENRKKWTDLIYYRMTPEDLNFAPGQPSLLTSIKDYF